MTAYQTIKAKAATQSTSQLVDGFLLLANKQKLEEHERVVRFALLDLIEERKGEDYIDQLLAFEESLIK